MKLTITRETADFDQHRNYKIILDNLCIGKIASDENVTFDISPGSHVIYLKIDWCRSNKIKFDTSNNSLKFQCGNSMHSFLKGFFAIFYMTFFKNKYLWIKNS